MDKLLSPQEFAARVKEKYPEYAEVDDLKLAQSVVEKYPEYADRVSFDAKEDPSLARIGGGLVAEVAVAEGAKYVGAATGAAIGSAVPVLGTAVGAGIGYASGAIVGGVSGSLLAQEIEGREEISYGRVVADTMLNLIPFAKAAKGAKFSERALSGVKRQGATGAIVAPSAQIIEAVIDDDKDVPTVRELGQSTLLGAALGSSLGVSSEAASGLYRKFAGKSAREMEQAILRGDKDAVQLSDAITNAADFKESTSATPREYLKKLSTYAMARLAPTKITGKEVFQIAKEAKDTSSASKELGAIWGSKIDDAIKKAPDPKLASDQSAAYLMSQTDKLPTSLDSVLPDLEAARVQRYKLQKEIIDNHDKGSRVLPEPLINEIRRSHTSGDYMTREYQFFENSRFTPSKQDTEALKKSLRAGGKSQVEVEEFLADLNKKRSGGPDEIRKHVMSTRTGVLKERKDLSPQLRKYLGEITDPGEKISGTISRLGRLAAYDTADRRIREAFLEMGLAKKAGQGIDDPSMTPLQLRGGVSKDVDGTEVFVSKDIQRALDAFYAPGMDNKTLDVADSLVSDAFRTGIATSKAAKVIMNPPSYMVQVYGNLASLLGMGMNPFRGAASGWKVGRAQFNDYAKKLAPKDIQLYKRALELDLGQPGTLTSDIRKGLEGKFFGEKVGEIINPLGKGYSTPDIMFRVSAWQNYQKFLRKGVPSLNEKKNQELLEEFAARLTNDTYQNYNFLNQSLRTLSQYGVLGQFAAFSLELMRNQFNQVNLAKRMISGQFAEEVQQKFGSANAKAIREEGLKRMAALTAVYGTTTAGISQINKMYGGVEEKEEKAMRESVFPDYVENRELIIKKGEDGKIFYKNGSYLVPHAQMIGVGRAAMRGENFNDAIAKAFDALKEEVGGEGSFFMNAIVNAVQNRDPNSGRRITSEVGSSRNMQDRLEWMVGEAFEPGIWREIIRATDEERGQSFNQTALRQAGIRIEDTTIEEGAGFKVREVSDAVGEVNRSLASARFKFSGEDFEREFATLSRVHDENFAKLIKHVKNYRVLGLNEDSILKLMKENGISGAKALMAVDGKTPKLEKVKRVTPTSMWSDIQKEGLSMPAMRKKILEMEDKKLRKSLLSKWESERKMQRLGIGERERTLKGMGIDDGERASFILEEMRQSQNPTGVLNKYRQQGIATNEVVRQVRLRQEAAQAPANPQ